MSMASHGQPSRKAPSGPLLVQSLHPIQSRGSTTMRPNGGWSKSGAQYMHSSTGQYSTHTGEPAQPVQHSLITAMMCGLRFRRVFVPSELGAYFTTLPDSYCSMLGISNSATAHPWWSLSQNYSCRPPCQCQPHEALSGPG